jgi:hypothetical protein
MPSTPGASANLMLGSGGGGDALDVHPYQVWQAVRSKVPVRSFAGMVGLLALLAAFVIGGLAAIGVLSDAATSTGVGGSDAEAEIPSDERTTVSVEEPVEAGSLSWTISEARRTGEIRSYTYPPTTLYGDFIIIAFSVENTSDGPITLTDEEMTLMDEETGTAGGPAASVNGEYVPPARNPLFTEEGLLDPGEKTEGRVNFDLSIPFGQDPALDLSGFKLELGDGDPTAEEEERVDLGL